MAEITLRPNETFINEWVAWPTGTAHAGQSDDTDGTYLRDETTGWFPQAQMGLTDPSPAIPVGAKIMWIRLRVRARRGDPPVGSGNPSGRAEIGFMLGINSFGHSEVSRNVTTFQLLQGNQVATKWDGSAITIADITNLRVVLTSIAQVSSGGSIQDARLEISETYALVNYNERPVAEYTGPTGVIGDTSQPTVTWDYSDPENDPQQAFRVLVREDDSSGVIVHDSGWVSSTSARSYQLPALDNSETYWARVEVRQVWGGAGTHGSNPDDPNAAGTFSLDLDAPAAPIFTATAEPIDARVRLELDDPGTTEPAAEWYTIEYRDSPIDPWVTVRGAVKVELPNPVTIYDYEAPFIRLREYRARAFIDISGLIIGSGWSLAQEILEMPYGSTWITSVKDPDDINFAVHKNPDRVRTWRGVEVVHQPANMDLAIIEADETTPQDTISFFSTNEQEHDILKKIFKSTQILLYRDDRREHFYFRWVGDRTRSQIGNRRIDADLFTGTQVLTSRPF